ncbi:MAG: hypothetical protein J7L80_00155, partial [Thermoplasmata archaeon]|nr:hypothetical protein [Thermoplasmata archaeon]
MNVAKFAILILFLYILSIIISYLIRIKGIFTWLNIFFLSLAIFSILFVIFIFILALLYAIIKKPEIEEGSYSINRIK